MHPVKVSALGVSASDILLNFLKSMKANYLLKHRLILVSVEQGSRYFTPN